MFSGDTVVCNQNNQPLNIVLEKNTSIGAVKELIFRFYKDWCYINSKGEFLDPYQIEPETFP